MDFVDRIQCFLDWSKKYISCTQSNDKNLLVIEFFDSFLHFYPIITQLVYIHKKICTKGLFLVNLHTFSHRGLFDHSNHILDSCLRKKFSSSEVCQKYAITLLTFVYVNLTLIHVGFFRATIYGWALSTPLL